MASTKPPHESKKKSASEAGSKPEWATTAIHLPKATLQLLKIVAFHRSQVHGGRMSVSRLLTDLVEAHRKELEQEATPKININ